MKKKMLPVIALMLMTGVTALTGCSSNQVMTTNDGRSIITDGKPQIDEETGLISYTDAQTGLTEQINRSQIKNMSELNL
ncbi:YgdI/YgdR family lipoprotein [Pantoea sp.]|uniref:YgdI/YgdR family lipoprotein n=1 Tax=Pantoea sp. TaxID=69393 RepID=UPI00289B6730|nr:YgdI/YgdR family lipoprotein [Pantoea sp.]